MNNKICSKCLESKPLDCFYVNKTKKDGRSFVCKTCHKEYNKKHYSDNKNVYKQSAKLSRDKRKKWWLDKKSNLKCSVCDENHPATLDFHHTDPLVKDGDLSKMIGNGVKLENILKEIEKCVVLCANCHRKLHYNERIA